VAADASSFHPVQEWLDAQEWDGVKRIGMPAIGSDTGQQSWLTKYLHTEDNNYIRLVGRWHAIASVARIYDPGCQVDYVPIAEGAQGKKKTTAIRALYHPWYSDTPFDLGSKDKYESLFGVWGYELSEFDQYNKYEAAVMKAFVSKREDKFRRPYGHADTINKRRVVFFASVNPGKPYINDETGGRRWLPFRTSINGERADVDGIDRDRGRFWAEAREIYQLWARTKDEHCRWWPEESWEEHLCKAEQDDRQSLDVWFDSIAGYVAGLPQEAHIKPLDVLITHMNLEKSKCDERASERVQRCLRMLGCTRVRDAVAGEDQKRGYHYRKPPEKKK
jgi:predicted P-loop ATPase